jgi:hypothetical protein
MLGEPDKDDAERDETRVEPQPNAREPNLNGLIERERRLNEVELALARAINAVGDETEPDLALTQGLRHQHTRPDRDLSVGPAGCFAPPFNISRSDEEPLSMPTAYQDPAKAELAERLRSYSRICSGRRDSTRKR